MSTVGHFGVSAKSSDSAHKYNASRVLTLLVTNGLSSAASFYPARLGVGHRTYYSSIGRGFQLDHIFIRRRDLVTTTVAGKLKNAGPVMSDHCRLRIELRHAYYGRKQQVRRGTQTTRSCWKMMKRMRPCSGNSSLLSTQVADGSLWDRSQCCSNCGGRGRSGGGAARSGEDSDTERLVRWTQRRAQRPEN